MVVEIIFFVLHGYTSLVFNTGLREKFKDRVSLGTNFHSRLLHINTIRAQATTHARFSLKLDSTYLAMTHSKLGKSFLDLANNFSTLLI